MLPPSSGGMSSRKTSGGASSRIFYIREELHRISRVHSSTSVYFHAYIPTYPSRSLAPLVVMPVVCSRRALTVRRTASMPGVCSAKVRASSAPMMMSAVV